MNEQTCPSCGVPYVDHDGLIRTCAKLQTALHPPPGDPRQLTTMAEKILAHVEKRPNDYGVEYRRDVLKPGCFGLQEPYELAVAYLSSPAWHDRPTGPGLWMKRSGTVVMVVPHDMGQRHVEQWPGGRVFGPIPADTKKGK